MFDGDLLHQVPIAIRVRLLEDAVAVGPQRGGRMVEQVFVQVVVGRDRVAKRLNAGDEGFFGRRERVALDGLKLVQRLGSEAEARELGSALNGWEVVELLANSPVTGRPDGIESGDAPNLIRCQLVEASCTEKAVEPSGMVGAELYEAVDALLLADRVGGEGAGVFEVGVEAPPGRP